MRVVIAAAGTGGHINPGIAIANKIKKEEPNSEIIFIGTDRGLEKDLVSRAGYRLKTINAYGFSKKISIENIRRIAKTIKGFGEAKKILKEFKPDIVIGTGGYICGAVISSAHKLHIPTALHESNAYPGLAVKMLSKKVDLIMVGFENAKKNLPKAQKVIYTGTPTKVKAIKLSDNEKTKIREAIGLNDKIPTVLVFGGSQGAKAINDAITKLIEKKLNKKYQIIWSAGQEQYNKVKEELANNSLNIDKLKQAKIVPYIYNMQDVMAMCDLVVARSGAMTLTEIALLGKPSIFIPLPSSSANRQEDNARVFEQVGAAKVILNNDVNEDILDKEINSIIDNNEIMETMSTCAKSMAVYDVEDRIYTEVKKLITRNK